MTNVTKTPDLTLTGSLLVVQYNEMVATAIDLGLDGVREVNRFKDNATGVARTEKLHSTIQARVASNKAADEDKGPEVGHLVETNPGEFSTTTGSEGAAPAAHEANAVEDTSSQGNTAPETTEEELTQLPDETEEAFMARKAAKKSAKKAPKKGAVKAKSTNGSTIREMTEEYNAIVKGMTKAQKEAAPYAKHHTSNFESKDKAAVQLKKLKDAIKKA